MYQGPDVIFALSLLFEWRLLELLSELKSETFWQINDVDFYLEQSSQASDGDRSVSKICDIIINCKIYQSLI